MSPLKSGGRPHDHLDTIQRAPLRRDGDARIVWDRRNDRSLHQRDPEMNHLLIMHIVYSEYVCMYVCMHGVCIYACMANIGTCMHVCVCSGYEL